MLGEYGRHLIAGDGAVVSCGGIRPEEHVQGLVKAALVADNAQPPDVPIKPVLCVPTAFFFCSSTGGRV